jgi:hypothetical protein
VLPEDSLTLPEGCAVFPEDHLTFPEDRSTLLEDFPMLPELRSTFPEGYSMIPEDPSASEMVISLTLSLFLFLPSITGKQKPPDGSCRRLR